MLEFFTIFVTPLKTKIMLVVEHMLPVIQTVLNTMMSNPLESAILMEIDRVSKIPGAPMHLDVDWSPELSNETVWRKFEMLGYGVFPGDQLRISWKPVAGFNGGTKIQGT